jgi:hypothetical protein
VFFINLQYAALECGKRAESVKSPDVTRPFRTAWTPEAPQSAPGEALPPEVHTFNLMICKLCNKAVVK